MNDGMNMKLTFSNFCFASLITFISSSFLVFENDLEYDEFLLSVLCFALMLRRPKHYEEKVRIQFLILKMEMTHFFRLYQTIRQVHLELPVEN